MEQDSRLGPSPTPIQKGLTAAGAKVKGLLSFLDMVRAPTINQKSLTSEELQHFWRRGLRPSSRALTWKRSRDPAHNVRIIATLSQTINLRAHRDLLVSIPVWVEADDLNVDVERKLLLLANEVLLYTVSFDLYALFYDHLIMEFFLDDRHPENFFDDHSQKGSWYWFHIIERLPRTCYRKVDMDANQK